jgi:hypothetical protein
MLALRVPQSKPARIGFSILRASRVFEVDGERGWLAVANRIAGQKSCAAIAAPVRDQHAIARFREHGRDIDKAVNAIANRRHIRSSHDLHFAGIAGLAGAQRACTGSTKSAVLDDAVPLLTAGDPTTLFSGKIANTPRADGRTWQASGRLAADAPYDSLGGSIHRLLCLKPSSRFQQNQVGVRSAGSFIGGRVS